MDRLVESLDEQGNKLSPVLPSGKKNYLIDIDGTVGEDIPNEEPERMATAEAYPDAIETINRWYIDCLLYTSPSPRDRTRSRMPSSA